MQLVKQLLSLKLENYLFDCIIINFTILRACMVQCSTQHLWWNAIAAISLIVDGALGVNVSRFEWNGKAIFDDDGDNDSGNKRCLRTAKVEIYTVKRIN